ncbi:MAG TPA: hypothetical protein VHX44_17200, partial [Planctomycetota bacterium]|nr:hypothetical protein [Planctomycetota bacterium]
MSAIRRPAALIAALTLGTGALTAADFVEWTNTSDWYVSLGVAPAPEVEEVTSGPGGSSTYEWKSLEDSVAMRLAIGYLACSGGTSGGWSLGVEGVVTTCDVTPARYHVKDNSTTFTFGNTSSATLHYSTLGATLFGGYQYGINADADNISSFLVVGPFLGGGAAFADSEVRDQQTQDYSKDSGIGWYLEGGLRFGFFLTEKH